MGTLKNKVSNLKPRFKNRSWVAALAIAALALPLLGFTPAVISPIPVPDSPVTIALVPYRIVVIDDPDLPADVEVVQTEGVKGKARVFVGGGTDEGPVVRQVVLSEPIDKVILRGVGEDLPVVAAPRPIPKPEPEPVPEPVVEQTPQQETTPPVEDVQATSALHSVSDLMFQGVINWNGYKFTYYSQSVLPGPGLAIPGRHVNDGGFVSDSDGYIVLAAPYGISHGTVFSTPFGYEGKVYDTCASCSTSPTWLDVYTR